MHTLFLTLAILVSAGGQIQYKRYTLDRKRITFTSTIALFFMTPFFSYLALKGITVDVVYMATSLNSFVVLMMSRWWLKEAVSKKQIISSLIVAGGVFIYLL